MFLKSPFSSHYQTVTVLHFVPLSSPIAEQYEYLNLRDENNSKNGEGQLRVTKQYGEGQLRATEQRNKLNINMLVAWCLTEKPTPLMSNGACN